MANLNEIHSDVKVLQVQMDALTEALKPIAEMARTVAVHQEKWDNLEDETLPAIKTTSKEHSDELKSLNKWKWINMGGAGGLSGLISFLSHKIGG